MRRRLRWVMGQIRGGRRRRSNLDFRRRIRQRKSQLGRKRSRKYRGLVNAVIEPFDRARRIKMSDPFRWRNPALLFIVLVGGPHQSQIVFRPLFRNHRRLNHVSKPPDGGVNVLRIDDDFVLGKDQANLPSLLGFLIRYAHHRDPPIVGRIKLR